MKRCGEVRLADCRGTHEEHLRPAKARSTFPAMFAAIEKSGYRGHYMQAFGSLDDMLKGRQTLAQLADKGASGEKDLLGLLLVACPPHAVEPEKMQRATEVPPPPWAQGDERGMANQIGPATYQRCAWHMAQPDARSYELSQLRSATMPLAVRRAVRRQGRSRPSRSPAPRMRSIQRR